MNALDQVKFEYEYAISKHPHRFTSAHEAYGIIAEEFAEFFDEVRKPLLDRAAARRELAQVAACCIRAMEDIANV